MKIPVFDPQLVRITVLDGTVFEDEGYFHFDIENDFGDHIGEDYIEISNCVIFESEIKSIEFLG